ncbi:acyltransferase family protein [Devosia rhizoryzae]|uniref:Acyltransferase n=1 Tax=Devosia rhizoryzae TaxID=2774137 RepID=A0ABX7C2I0_9HYPH|nr:acyltransferase [Devosia rhizoryzae]QQR37978.1 acyltransferase [Devosia rhizoryzae]
MNTKLHTIQYLRAIAALMVLASHALLYPLAEQTLLYGRLGWLGVILFFVVSGFIMVAVTGEGRFDAGKFMRRRILRVVPLYWAATALAAAAALILPSVFKTTVFDGEQLILSLFFIPFYNPASHGFHPLYKLGWTLNYEMFFYVCFAVLAFLGATTRVWVLTIAYLALAIIGMMFRPTDAIPAFYTSFMPLAFVAGAWLGLAYIRGWLSALRAEVLFLVGLVGVFGLFEGFYWDRGLVEDQSAFVGLLSFAAATVALLVARERQVPYLPTLERLGDASYSIYLVHMFSVAAIAGVLLRMMGTDDPVLIFAAELAAIFGGVFVGYLIYRAIEKPLIGRLRRYA